MLSHLRFHRRGTSNPTSPAPDQPSPSPLSAQPSPFTPESASPLDGHASSAASSSLPPTLPPITRVTSTEINFESTQRHDVKPSRSESRLQQVPYSLPYKRESGFIGGVALRNYRRDVKAQQSAGVDNPEDNSKSQRSRPTSINNDLPTRSMPQILTNSKPISSFGIPADLQPSSTASNHHPPSSRISSEPPPSFNSVTTIEPQKGRKGLPFLKNPMSTLLARRKANQNTQNKLPISLASRTEEPTYDPRIRGTRVHDFSAPRRKNNVPTTNMPAALSASQVSLATETRTRYSYEAGSAEPFQGGQRRQLSNASDPTQPESASTISHPIAQSSSISSVGTKSLPKEQAPPPNEDQLAPPVPPKDDALPSLQSTPSKISGIKNRDVDAIQKTPDSTRTTRSRNVSLSSIPKHMKSTSSRFSFDMIGAAKQEKLLEERHRQRELDKKTAKANAPRDSMYDDFDEDAFDYDAMMDDDGLEERIPGVNADYDEEDQFIDDDYPGDDIEPDDAVPEGDDLGSADPDDDQENFAGFVFQRSNPVSSLASPQSSGLMATPRDADGKVIGFALSRDTPNSQGFPGTPDVQVDSTLDKESENRLSGLGIQGIDVSDAPQDARTGHGINSYPNMSAPLDTVPRTIGADDLYFDGGMTGFEDEFAEDLATEPEGDGVPFDESIFDNDDTDQFGRPVPGAFALAQSLRRATNQQSANRESDITSGFSAQSALSHSTAHTSLSVDKQQPPGENYIEGENTQLSASLATSLVAPIPTASNRNVVANYQAALAAAAHKAAASGKFERSSSPTKDEADDQAEPYTEPYGLETDFNESYDDYGYSYDGVDDYELDDDAIIAEANASALANDSDGWYGQEFGFYAAPINSYGPQNANAEGFGYANGGFFGPKGLSGLNRSTSGRVISREPNLTPITERSEYSNRNSVMSLGIPPINSGTPTIQSPGLAQLAMMADRGDDMTLSALLRLRTRAWGGSQASLVSSKDGSPRSEWGDAPSSPRTSTFAGLYSSTNAQGRKNSVFSIVSRDSEPGSAPGSPTLTLAIPSMPSLSSTEVGATESDTNPTSGDGSSTYLVSPGSHNVPPVTVSTTDVHDAPASAVSRSSTNSLTMALEGGTPVGGYHRKGHQRQKSSAESISYMKEEESGETRWVMERRRTGEFGQVEVLEREVVEGGRI